METEELKALLEQHHASSFGWAMACCRRDHAEAEDVLQIVYLKVLDGKARFNGASSFKTWLFAVIRKTASDQRRKNLLRGLTMLRAAERGTSSVSNGVSRRIGISRRDSGHVPAGARAASKAPA